MGLHACMCMQLIFKPTHEKTIWIKILLNLPYWLLFRFTNPIVVDKTKANYLFSSGPPFAIFVDSPTSYAHTPFSFTSLQPLLLSYTLSCAI